MKIAIIGAGWLGCHLALKLKIKNKVTLFESGEIFAQTSFKNQNRLHLGYHYARNMSTRRMCQETFERFIAEYSSLTLKVRDNFYAIPISRSLLDYATYLAIFPNLSSINTPSFLRNIEGVVVVDEQYIDPFKARKYFVEKLENIVVKQKITCVAELSTDYDLVINCTNNQLEPMSQELAFAEECSLLIYNKKKEPPFGALTLVDGDLFSIFPYTTTTISISDVQNTPSGLPETDLKLKIENHVQDYFPDFHKYFEYLCIVKSLKTKPKDLSAQRLPLLQSSGNIVSCSISKIQGIYYVEDYLKTLCKF